MSCRKKVDRGVFAVSFFLLIIIPAAGAAQQRDEALMPGLDEPYWQQRVDYEIHATLDPETHMLTGRETITYKNNSPDTLTEFYLHLYPNAYREKASPLIRDYMRGTLYFLVGITESRRGWLDVKILKVNGSDAAFSVDGTVLKSSFPKPLPPGGTVVLEVSFIEKIRKHLGRAGYAGDHYDLAQWYPKMAVYDRNGWHPDQFRMGEFYGEFGTFDVHIELPERFVIAATGTPVSGDPGWEKSTPHRGGTHHGGGHGGAGAAGGGAMGMNTGGAPETAGETHGTSTGGAQRKGGRTYETGTETPAGEDADTKTVHFRAENVHDFAWCANPHFVVQDTLYNGYRIMSFFEPWRRSWQDSVLARGLRAMQWLESFAGPYEYPQVSIVQSPTHGGMEYPMLAMNGNPSESLIFHELGHMYFYAILANDERMEAWMDEGVTQYQTLRYAEDHYGRYGEPATGKRFLSSLYPRPTMWDGLAKPIIDLHRTDHAERIATPHHEFKNDPNIMLYVKAPLFLRALHYVVGDENFRTIIHTYVERWKFKHVDETVFLSICEEVSGMELDEIFRQWLHTTKDCDYRVSRFKVKRAGDRYQADCTIERKGELMMPITLAFRLRNGNTVSERMDGLLRTVERTFTFDVEPVAVAINPDNEILDVHQVDNFSPRRRGVSLDLPYRDYYRQDAYEYRFLPIGYYNDIDGGKAGLRIRGSYDERYRKFTLQGLYGFESGRGDVFGSFAHPFGMLGRDAHFYGDAFYREGRHGVYAEISKIRRKSLFDPFAKHFSFRFLYHELNDSEYVYPYTYEEGINLRAGLDFSIHPTTDLFETSFTFDFDRSFWGSDFNYEKTSLEARMWPARRYPIPVKPYIRFYLGYSSIDPPLQETFNLAGAGVLEKENYFWLRSVGGFPRDQYNHFHVPGDANLRGYFDGDYSFRRVFASNIELELPLPLGRKMSRWLDHRLYLFYDWGKVLDEHPLEGLPPAMHDDFPGGFFDEILQDFGVGVNLWKLTVELPLYISHPILTGDEEEWDLRWTIGIDRLF